MPKYIAKLAIASGHPSVAVLSRADTGEILTQFPVDSVMFLLGRRTYGYWWVQITKGAWSFAEEVPREEVESS